jgi:xylulose-5-phosphate/fructose-6-phosphate phosphoketolase
VLGGWLRDVMTADAAHRHLSWRKPAPSLNYLLTSHLWREDHNGASYQGPGFIDHVMNKMAEVVRMYLPPDANTPSSVVDHCLRGRYCANVIVAGKQRAPTWLNIDDAALHCACSLGIWDWAFNDAGDPDAVLAAARDVPTLEIRAATDLLRQYLPDLEVRVVNVVDLMRRQPTAEYPHRPPDAEFDAIFTTDRPVLFAYHGYPWLIHRLTYRRDGHPNLRVRGFKEEGATTVLHARPQRHGPLPPGQGPHRPGPGLTRQAAVLRQRMVDERSEQHIYTRRMGEDLPEAHE